ncbi:MAG: LuxR C-terminal-related transcriptional regulator [Chloroflexota bacterium]|nr:LuxR C-terminal-related transcriptional regulator [Chloroflexota bacterium]
MPHILLVEDDRLHRDHMRDLLTSKTPYTVTATITYDEAINAFDPEIMTAAMIDIHIPKDNPHARDTKDRLERWGIRLAKELKARAPKLGIVFRSAFGGHLLEVNALIRTGLGGIAYMSKQTAGSQQLLYALQRVQLGQNYFDDTLVEYPHSVAGLRYLASLPHGLRFWVESAYEHRDELTERERQVWALRARSLKENSIAQQLGISVRTVEKHVDNLNHKLFDAATPNDDVQKDIIAHAVYVLATIERDISDA